MEQGGVPEHAHGAAASPYALIAEENANAEFLVGLTGSPEAGAVGRLASFQAKVALAQEAAKGMSVAAQNHRRDQRDIVAVNLLEDSGIAMFADIHASQGNHQHVCV